jgi:hypothetical protein
MSNVVALCVGFCGVVLFTHLLRAGLLGAPYYAALVTVTLLGAVAISRIDLLAVLDLKNLSVTLREIQQVRQDVYAKADIVKHMGEELADLVVFNVNNVGRFPSEDLDDKMLVARDRVAAVLKDLGSEPQKITDMIKPINDTVLGDLKHAVLRRLHANLDALLIKSSSPVLWSHVEKEFEGLLDSFDREKLMERARHSKLESPELDRDLDRLERFIRDNKL